MSNVDSGGGAGSNGMGRGGTGGVCGAGDGNGGGEGGKDNGGSHVEEWIYNRNGESEKRICFSRGVFRGGASVGREAHATFVKIRSWRYLCKLLQL